MATLTRRSLRWLVLLLAAEGLGLLVCGLLNRLLFHVAFLHGAGENLWIGCVVFVSSVVGNLLRPRLRASLGLSRPPSAGSKKP